MIQILNSNLLAKFVRKLISLNNFCLCLLLEDLLLQLRTVVALLRLLQMLFVALLAMNEEVDKNFIECAVCEAMARTGQGMIEKLDTREKLAEFFG